MSVIFSRGLALSRLPLFRPAVALLILAGAAALISAPNSPFTLNQRAAYLDPQQINFIRPGLVIDVTGAEIAADGTITARFKLTDLRGLALDREGVSTPGSVSVSFIAAYIPRGETQYVAYTTRRITSPINGVSAVQATGESNGAFTKIGEGDYTYTFATKAPVTIDRGVTHTIGAYGSRSLAEFDLGTQYDDDVLNFVPDGSPVTVTRDVIRTATCNDCHQDMAFHGGSRKTMEVCILCHTPQTVDPDTGNTVDMPVMTHKIHMGADLPSVQAGGKYEIIGNRQTVHDYSGIHFPPEARNCLMCHEQNRGAAQAANFFKPNRAACGACHDDVNFATGKNHLDLPQVSDNQCGSCHQQQGELDFDASIMGAHTIPRASKSLPGVSFEILSVSDAAPGKNPTVTFSIKDKAGNAVKPSEMARLNFRFAGPSTDYTTLMSEDARKAEGSDGVYYWTFLAPVPANAKGTFALGIEGRREIKLLEGTAKETVVRDTGANKTIFVSLDGSSPVPRRTVVTTAKCNECHGALAFHGDARNTVENCALCHNPTLVAGRGDAAQSVQFALMIHRIHRGHALERPYAIGNSNFNLIGYPGDLRQCSACHVNGSEQLPLNEGMAAVADPNGPLNPLMPTAAACTGCHDGMTAAAHIQANTTKLGESCAACHGEGKQNSVTRAHAR